MDTILLWGKVLVGVVVLLLAFLWVVLPLLRKFVPTWFGAGTSTVADTATAWADEISFLTTLALPWAIAKKRGDTMILDFLGKCRIQAATWDDPAPVVVPPVTVAALAADVAALKAAVASQTTATIPAATQAQPGV